MQRITLTAVIKIADGEENLSSHATWSRRMAQHQAVFALDLLRFALQLCVTYTRVSKSRHSATITSAFGGEADINHDPAACPLVTRSGHSPIVLNSSSDQICTAHISWDRGWLGNELTCALPGSTQYAGQWCASGNFNRSRIRA